MQVCWRGAVERGLAEKSDERSFLPKVRKTLPLKLLKRGHQPSAYPIEKLDRAKGFKPRRQAHISSREEGEVTRRRTLTLLTSWDYQGQGCELVGILDPRNEA